MLQPPLPRDDSPTNNTNSILSGNSLKGKETLRKELPALNEKLNSTL